MVMFFPSIHPSLLSSCRNTSKRPALAAAVLLSRKPMRKIFPPAAPRRDGNKSELRQREKRNDFVIHAIFLTLILSPSEIEILFDT